MNPFLAFREILSMYVDEKSLNLLPQLWNEKSRFYHSTNHLIQILQDIEKDIEFKELNVYEKHALLLSAFFHDAIYDPRKKDNEERSIDLFVNSFKDKTDTQMLNTVKKLIEVTKYRKRPIDKLQRIMWDADNAGFKKGYDTLLKNEKLIAQEYFFIPKKEYKQKRIEFLKTNIGLFNSSVNKDLEKLIKYVEKTY